MEEQIKATLIFEILGRPKEHIIQALKDLIEAIGKEKDIKIISRNVHDAKRFENKDKEGKIIPNAGNNELFSTFAEVELESKDLPNLFTVCFKYMPSHIEVSDPVSLELNNFEVSSLFTELMAKLHQYDAIAKTALMQNQMLAKKFEELSQNPAMAADRIKVTESLPAEKAAGKKLKKSKKK